MSDKPDRVVVRVDGYTRVCLTVIAVLLTVLIVGLWAEGVPASRHASAAPAPTAAGATPAPMGIPDAGGQRDKLVKEMERVTAKLDHLVSLFETGKAKVQVSAEGKEAGKDNAAKEAE